MEEGRKTGCNAPRSACEGHKKEPVMIKLFWVLMALCALGFLLSMSGEAPCHGRGTGGRLGPVSQCVALAVR